MSKLLTKDRKLKIALPLFVFLFLYGILIANKGSFPKLDGVALTFHCVDFSMGFCSGFLPGAVYNLFVKETSELSATVYEYILIVISYFGAALLIEKWYYSMPEEKRLTGAELLLFFITGSCTFAVYLLEPGMLDFSWFVLTLLFILAMQNKYARFILPLFFAVAVSVHFGALFSYVPFFALLLLYKVISNEDKKEKRIWLILFALSCAFAVLTFAYFSANNRSNLTYDIYKFKDIMDKKGSPRTFYYLFSLYFDPHNTEDFLKVTQYDVSEWVEYENFALFKTDSGIFGMLNALYYQFRIHLNFYFVQRNDRVFIQAGVLAAVLSPVVAMLYGYYIRFARSEKTRLSRFFTLCAIATVPFALSAMMISTDSVRWLSHGFFALFVLTLYIIYDKKGEPLEYFKEFFSRFSPFAKTAYFLIYALTVFNPYV